MPEQWMTEDQRYCYEMLCDCFGGAHRVPKVRPWGAGIKTSVCEGWIASFDSNYLTRLVFFAHDRCIRVAFANGGPYRVAVILHRRHTRDGDTTLRHPTIEQALVLHRRSWPAPNEAEQEQADG
jgi:hypothetical protein